MCSNIGGTVARAMHQVDEEARYCKQSVQRSFDVTGVPDEKFSDWICALNLELL